jgi:signal transduction histidine kinase
VKCCLAVLFATTLAVAGPAFGAVGATTEEAKAMLDRAVKLVQTDGEEKALAAFNDPKGSFRDRDLYVFCYGTDKKITAHPMVPLGTDVTSIKNSAGESVGKQWAEVAEKGGGSLEYRWTNPVSKKLENKVSFFKKAGNQVCGVGAYK